MAKKNNDSTLLMQLVVQAALEKKAHNVVSLDLRKIKDTVSDYFVITHGDSPPQVRAICDSIQEETAKIGTRTYHSEGGKNADWIILDFVDVVVHVFHRDKREFYQLEDLWSDAVLVKHESKPDVIPVKATSTKTTKTKTVKKKI